MRYLRGARLQKGRALRWHFGALALLAVVVACGTVYPLAAPRAPRPQAPHQSPSPALTLPAVVDPIHTNIVATIFWVGELADGDNGGIANRASAWDQQWQFHYGGADSPSARNGFLPAGFTPHENPFYIALPYSDITDAGARKTTAALCPLYTQLATPSYSWCKNSWVAIRYGDKTAYAQWEDTGPFAENDTAYVFGNAPPSNAEGVGAGLDVSPAIRDYLGLSDVSTCSWWFIEARQVPGGPWRQIVTTNPGDSIN